MLFSYPDKSSYLRDTTLAELLGLSFWQTEKFLAERGISRPYTEQDFDGEMAHLDRVAS